MPRVAIAVGAYPYDFQSRGCYIALSIDEPIPTEFLTESPEKIWCLYHYDAGYGTDPYRYPKILNIPEGTHTLYFAAYSPPTIPWKILLTVYGATASKNETAWLWKGQTDTITINVSSAGAPYSKAIFPYSYQYIADGLTNYFGRPVCEPFGSDAFPRLWAANVCFYTDGIQCLPVAALKGGTLVAVIPRTFTQINPYKGEQFQVQFPIITKEATYSHIWWKIKEVDRSLNVSLYPTSFSPYYTDPCYEFCLRIDNLPAYSPPLYVARDIVSGDTITLQIGHIENDTLPSDQWTFVLDSEMQVDLHPRTSTFCKAPPPPTGVSLQVLGIGIAHEAPIDPRPGRRIFVSAVIKNTGSVGFWPYVSVNEGPTIFKEVPGRFTTYLTPGGTIGTAVCTLIDDQMISQGYVTLNIGYYAPASYPSGTLIGAMEGKILQTIRVPIKVAAAQIWDVQMTSTGPAATIDNVNLQPVIPKIAASIDNVNLQPVAPKIAASIDNVNLQPVVSPPPPPPPPAGYTFSGKVLSILGPVAEAEVSLNGLSAKTAGDGSFTITDIPEGTYTLTVKPTRIHEKILLKSVTQKIGIYMNTSKTIMLPLNITNLAIGAGATVAVGAVVAATRKPKPPTW